MEPLWVDIVVFLILVGFCFLAKFYAKKWRREMYERQATLDAEIREKTKGWLK